MNKFAFTVVASDTLDLPEKCLMVLPLFEHRAPTYGIADVAEATRVRVESAIRSALPPGSKSASFGKLSRLSVVVDDQLEQCLLVGCGRKSRFSERRFIQILEKVSAEIASVETTSEPASVVCLFHRLEVVNRSRRWKYEQFVQYLERRTYRYEKRFNASRVFSCAEKRPVWISEKSSELTHAREHVAVGAATARGISLARNLSDMPPNTCTPEFLASFAVDLAESDKRTSANILGEAELAEHGMGAILAVTRGSAEPAKIIVLDYQGADATHKPYCLVGKGVTFDSGGLSLKPAAAMERMKYDMCGAAAVLGAFVACVELNLPINIRIIIAAAENMPDGSAVKPGDVVTTFSGRTVEVLNTDAEGRLLLCDAISYAKSFKPAVVIDVATLTGACVQALGTYRHGLFSNSQSLARSLEKAGRASSDHAWHLPVGGQYDKALKSKVADLRNIGGEGAGAVVAASYLAQFANRIRWAHLDIAGTATRSGVGATGRPVALLVRYLITRRSGKPSRDR